MIILSLLNRKLKARKTSSNLLMIIGNDSNKKKIIKIESVLFDKVNLFVR
jgi:hypothetical protein